MDSSRPGSAGGNYIGTTYFRNGSASAVAEAMKKANQEARAMNIRMRQCDATRFRNSCTLDSVMKTYIRSGFATSWNDKSYGISWVAVHSMDVSVCVVTRHADLDRNMTSMTKYGWNIMLLLTAAIVSEVESLPFDDDFRKRSGLTIEKPFGLVSVFPGQPTSSVEYDKDKAINFFMENMSESVITLDDATKMAISAFKELCIKELEAEEYWVAAFQGRGCVSHREPVSVVEKLLVDINSGCYKGNKSMGAEGSENMDSISDSGSDALSFDENVISM